MTQPAVADVLVIGSGASGAAVSWRLAGLGASVICLEQGDWVDRERLPKNHVDWEVRTPLLGGQPERPPLAGRLPGGQRG